MIVYVESNFIFELAYLREEHENCDKILNLSASGDIRLVLPAFSLTHLAVADRKPKCFITRDSKDFANPDIVEDLSRHNCELCTSFGEGYGFIIR